MSETPTPPPENTPATPQPGEIVTPEELEKFNEWAASGAAARRLVEQPAVPPATEAQAAPQEPETTDRKQALKKAAGIGLATVAVGGGAYVLADLAADAIDHQIEHNQEVGEEALRQQEEARRMLEDGVVVLEAPKSTGK